MCIHSVRIPDASSDLMSSVLQSVPCVFVGILIVHELPRDPSEQCDGEDCSLHSSKKLYAPSALRDKTSRFLNKSRRLSAERTREGGSTRLGIEYRGSLATSLADESLKNERAVKLPKLFQTAET